MKFDIFMTVKFHICFAHCGFVTCLVDGQVQSVVSNAMKMEAVFSSTSTLLYYHSAWCHNRGEGCYKT